MKSLPVGELKAQFSEVLEKVQQGESFEVVYGKKKKPVARIVPINSDGSEPENKKRKLGILEGKARVIFADDFKMTEEEFMDLR
ncbi:MAG TPA: type II toxin-antitoxin system prevent-host-death family antitoxin [Pyrinomonadaceae bacterium]|nr:type II toxin-antitoxin system prevent-host-death family antitoxin [Pyrinomonadaceae bacterium]